MKPVLYVATLALVAPGDKVLWMERPDTTVFPGCWELPGGKVEPGETPRAAAVREMREECGIGVADSDLEAVGFAEVGIDTHELFIAIYAARRWDGEALSLERQRFAWQTPVMACTLRQSPGSTVVNPVLSRHLARGTGHGRR